MTDSISIVGEYQTDGWIQQADSLKNGFTDHLDVLLSTVGTVRETLGFGSYPQNEFWVVGVFLFFFFATAIVFFKSSNFILDGISSFFQVKRRQSLFREFTQKEAQSQYFLLFLSFLIISLYAYFYFWEYPNKFSFLVFLCCLAFTIIVFGLKMLLLRWVAYVFIDKESYRVANESYMWIIVFWGYALFPVMLVGIYSPESISDIAVTIAMILPFAVLLITLIKLFQIFHKIKLDIFYLLLYLCTLEILPLFLAIKGYEFIVLDVIF